MRGACNRVASTLSLGGWSRAAALALALVATAGALVAPAVAAPYAPANESQILARLPAGTQHADLASRRLARGRIDVAVPLAQFYIRQARTSGDLRYLGYAESVLQPWVGAKRPAPPALVLEATVQQSRHEFGAALATLDRSMALQPNDPQAWLTRAIILRVLGRYREAGVACDHFAVSVDAGMAAICQQGLRALQGQLAGAYAALAMASNQGMLGPEIAWRDTELGEMAVRLGRDRDAENWFIAALGANPTDFYVRAAYADLLLRQRRDVEFLALLKDQDSIEPLLLRLAIAQQRLHDAGAHHSAQLLQAAFAAESQRAEAVHGREQARFLLEIENQPRAALGVALTNWSVQREPDDALVLLRAARDSGDWQAATPVLDFVRAHHLQDARLASVQPGVP